MKIINLEIENIKKIRAVEISPKGNTIVISGANEAGKSTVLDSIFYALTGKVSVDPLKHGKKKGTVRVELDDYIVTKTITEKGAYLKVENKEGQSFQSPQKFLDAITGKLSFDPMAFAGLKAREQKETLLGLIGVDFTKLEQAAEGLREDRLIIGRDVKKLEANIDTLGVELDGLPDEEIDIFKLTREIEIEKGKERNRQGINSRIDDNNQNISFTENQIADRELRIEDRLKEITSLKESIQGSRNEIIELQVKSEKIKFNYADLETKLSTAQVENEKFRQGQKTVEMYESLAVEKAGYKKATEDLELIEEKKQEKLKKAELPLPGLSVDEQGIIYKGNMFAELSSAEQLKVSLAIAMKLNPKLKVITIKDGSLIDSKNMKIIEDMAKGQDYQVWIEKVDETGTVGLYIEEGVITKKN